MKSVSAFNPNVIGVVNYYNRDTKYGFNNLFFPYKKYRMFRRRFIDSKCSYDIISFLGICAALQYAIEEDISEIKVFCKDIKAIEWVKNSSCECDLDFDEDVKLAVSTAIDFLTTNNCSAKIFHTDNLFDTLFDKSEPLAF